ncbi:hypothetical protein NXS19_013017 [Fusarium pseudograminearum]|nr:hypothetical protein NXS19_013017 [Fusarium pseudograminearum]
MTQPFNRYSWIVLRDMFGHDFDHHGKSAKFLGHVFSIIAKIALQTEDVGKQFWLDNMHLLTLGCFEIINDKTVDFTQELLSDADDGELKLEEDEDELGTRRTKPSKKSRFQSVAPKTMNDILQLDSDDDGMDHAADIAYMQEQPADGVEAPANEPLADQEGEQVEDSGEEFQTPNDEPQAHEGGQVEESGEEFRTPTNKRSADVEGDEVEEPDTKRARTE